MAWDTSEYAGQEAAPLLDSLKHHVRRSASRWHTPGHKGVWTDPEWLAMIGETALAWDVTELPGLDNLHCPAGPIAAAEGLAARLYGGDRAFFLTNGASAGLQAVVLSLGAPGTVLLPRHAHRSLVSALTLSGRRPVWLVPERVGPWHLPVGPGSATLQTALARACSGPEKPALVVLVHPTYPGYAADLRASIAACHACGVPVLVDAAHGAHLFLSKDLPEDPIAAGADAAVYSLHKTLGACTGAALLVTKGSRLDQMRIQSALTMLQTSSPSYLLLASLDAARRAAALAGPAHMQALLPALAAARQRLRQAGWEVPDASGPLPAGYGHDATKLLLSLAHRGYSGPDVSARLFALGIDLEMAEAHYALALVTPADATRASLPRLTDILVRLAAGLPALPPLPLPDGPDSSLPAAACTPAEAQARPWTAVPLTEAAGHVAAALVSISPPGIASLVPGELIDQAAVDELRAALAAGLVVQGILPGDSPAILVVAN